MTELVVLGRVLTVDEDRRVIEDGAIYIHDGRIERVGDASSPPPPGYEDAPRVHTGGVVAPGLIDLHNHLAYNTLPLWVGRDAPPYTTRYQWPGAPTYQTRRLEPGAGARHRGAGGRVALRGGESGCWWRHRRSRDRRR